MSRIVLGSADGNDVNLDIDVLLRTRLLIQANSGQGKSFLLRRLAEQLFGKVQIIMIDPEGEFSTLREKFDFVLIGEGGDAPIHVPSAGLLAHRLLELRASAICNIYDGVLPQTRHEWVRVFLDALVDSPRKFWHPCVVIVDESHKFCPERKAGESEASQAMIRLATDGRKRGFAAVWATQRLAKLDKNASAELLNRLVGGTFEDVDLDRALDLLSVAREDIHQFRAQLKVLEPGQFYAIGRAISKERKLLKVGAVATVHPEAGSSRMPAEPPPPTEHVRELLSKLADLPQEAERKAKTEAELRNEIRSLKAQLRTVPKPTTPVLVADERAIAHAITHERYRWRNIFDQQHKLLVRYSDGIERLAQIGQTLPAKPDLETMEPKGLKIKRRFIVKDLGETVAAKTKEIERAIGDPWPLKAPTGALPPGELAILRACAQYDDGAARDQLSVLTGYKRSSRDAYISRLIAKSYVGLNGGTIKATGAGIAALGDKYEPLPTGPELVDHWMDRLPEGERRIFEILVKHGNREVSREALSDGTGYMRSSRDAYLSRLGARRLVEVTGAGMVKATDTLFE